MMLSYAKPFNKKMREQLVKIWKKKQTCEGFLLTFSWWYEKEKKKRKSVMLVQKYSTKNNNIHRTGPKAYNFVKFPNF